MKRNKRKTKNQKKNQKKKKKKKTGGQGAHDLIARDENKNNFQGIVPKNDTVSDEKKGWWASKVEEGSIFIEA